jgi:septum site-determining protein MinD
MARRGEMMNVEDIEDILAIDLIGVVPDDEEIVMSTNRGEPAVFKQGSLSGMAFRNISKRIIGESVPFMEFDVQESFFDKLKRALSFGK